MAALVARGIATQCELDDSRYELSRVQAEGAFLVQQTFARWQTRRREEQTALDALVSEENGFARNVRFTRSAPRATASCWVSMDWAPGFLCLPGSRSAPCHPPIRLSSRPSFPRERPG